MLTVGFMSVWYLQCEVHIHEPVIGFESTTILAVFKRAILDIKLVLIPRGLTTDFHLLR
jgi:hypothetical protein